MTAKNTASGDVANLRCDEQRLWNSLEAISTFGATEAGGLHRLTASPEDGQARDWLVNRAKELDCSVRIDRLGNIFIRRPASDDRADSKAILFGSHLDSQPMAGKYDGVYGVMAGLEVLATLAENDVATNHPLELVCWTNEEGARYAPAMMGSAYFAGELDGDEALARTDEDDIALEQALRDINYAGTDHVSPDEFAAYFEAHIEQGPILEDRNLPIGVVTGIQGISWFQVTITGRAGHSGTSPMETRRDALVAASDLILRINRIGRDHPNIGRATVGTLRVHPGSPNVVPGGVDLMVEFRHPTTKGLQQMVAELRSARSDVAHDHGVRIELEEELDSAPVDFDASMVDVVEQAAEHLGLASTRLVSGAGHDAVYASKHLPAAMIFIPCVDGVSHAEDEAITSHWAIDGANVLLHAVLRADQTALNC